MKKLYVFLIFLLTLMCALGIFTTFTNTDLSNYVNNLNTACKNFTNLFKSYAKYFERLTLNFKEPPENFFDSVCMFLAFIIFILSLPFELFINFLLVTSDLVIALFNLGIVKERNYFAMVGAISKEVLKFTSYGGGGRGGSFRT